MTAGNAARIPDPAAAAPRGTRVRAGNSMGRTRLAVAIGTAEAIRLYGARKATMIDIAASAGIAKGTLYNHVRTRSEAYQLLAETEIGRLLEVLKRSGDLVDVLSSAGDFLATHPVVRALSVQEPAVLAVLCIRSSLTAAGFAQVDAAIEGLVGEVSAPLIRRWLLSLMFDAGDEQGRRSEASALAGVVVRQSQSVYRATQAG